MKYEIHHSECLAFMRTLPDNHIDAIVTDPPYGLSFMGKKWDYDVPSEDIFRECLRVLKPGGHMLAFAGTRTQHRMAVRIEDAGFEIRDMIAWVYGSGFPKSLDVSKAIDRAAGAEREVVGVAGKSTIGGGDIKTTGMSGGEYYQTAPATDGARQWQGWGTALKPALEPITVARKPLIGTVAANVLTHGTGALNIDGCRVTFDMVKADAKNFSPNAGVSKHNANKSEHLVGLRHITNAQDKHAAHKKTITLGRWPANLIHDGSEEVVGVFPANAGANPNNVETKYEKNSDHLKKLGPSISFHHNDGKGSAARFFYCAKASKRDRDEGCEGMDAKQQAVSNIKAQRYLDDVNCADGKYQASKAPARNHHPTVKPTDLMRYLCRLVTPPGGTIFDPFMGSGSTGKAAVLEGFNFIGCDMTSEYVEIALARIEHALNTKPNTLF